MESKTVCRTDIIVAECSQLFVQVVYRRPKPKPKDDLIDPAYYDFTYEPRNREGLERALMHMNAAYPGHESIIEEIVGEGDTVGVCLTIRGTHAGIPVRGIPAPGKPFEIGAYRFFKIRDGKILSHRGLLDLPSLLQQVGTND